MSGTNVLIVKRPAEKVADGIFTLGGQGNSVLVDHGDGALLVDAGPGGEVTETMIRNARAVNEKPITHIVFSHGHMGYNFGVDQWCRDAKSRGEPRPTLVAHDRVPARYRRYIETSGLQSYTNTRQFRTVYPENPPAHWFVMPDVTYDKQMRVSGVVRDIVLFHAPSETDDATALWIPGDRVLYGSCAFIKSCPNAGSPFRIPRDPLRWAETLEGFLALKPKILIPEFGKPLVNPAEIEEALTVPIHAIHYLRREVVARMNRGMNEVEIIHDIQYKEALFGHRFLKPTYGCPEYLVREIWRSENGWWDRNPTTLHPSPPSEAAEEILRAIGDPHAVMERVRILKAQGKTQAALHVIDLIALANPDGDLVTQAQWLKAELLEIRSTQVTSVVSRQIYRSEAEVLRGEDIGSSDRGAIGKQFVWS